MLDLVGVGFEHFHCMATGADLRLSIVGHFPTAHGENRCGLAWP